ncbi:GNAT family N-acetyltransferase [Natronococcus sp. A-GB1]|uniref:GNAT family N-acetyltransferase n=1 Tax=Natronococcus sp. A-GB1 TaxID=3037648 RepID=UPI00241C916F|nr:GNAT family N-acetyltransferase [Natronococcus sp. A-GB1]MDG5758291.1 GNAT family N-acetyltransferase [Natronococcus sp. A-GB1]
MHVRVAGPDDALEVRRMLDAAMLEPGDVEGRIGDGDVLVAGDRKGGSDGTDERLLGALVLEPRERGAHVASVGVRRRHRGRGIGRRLVEQALERERRLTARFDDGVRPFYEALEFAIEPIGEDRHRGVAVADRGE